MTVETLNSIDGLGISKTDGTVVLMISDHLDWADEQKHFGLLEKKIDAYLGFINSGQLKEQLPDAKGRPIRIEVVYQYEPSESAARFLKAAKQQLLALSIELIYVGLPNVH